MRYKISNKLGVSREWLENGTGNILGRTAYSIGGDISIGSKVEKAVQDAMSASEDSAFSKASNILGGSENALERENRLLREQLAQKDAQISPKNPVKRIKTRCFCKQYASIKNK